MLQNNIETNADIHSFPNTGPQDFVAQVDTLKIVSCPICQAVYTPSSQQLAAAQSSLALLETAFLRVCHFCFRCQRPACPQCWYLAHSVCAACAEEAHLPFRSPVSSFEGLIFSPPPASSQTTQVINLPFTCLHNGRFYSPDATPRPAALPSRANPLTSPQMPLVQVKRATPTSSYPSWLQEIPGQKPNNQSAGKYSQEVPQLVGGRDHSVTLPAHSAHPIVSYEARQPAWLREARVWPQPPGPPSSVVEDTKNSAQDYARASEDMFLVERIENVVILCTSVILIAIMFMIVLALSSAEINEFFFRLLHVDFRAEIAYLWQVI